MIRVIYHRNFLKLTKKLSKKLQIRLASLFAEIAKNPFHPSLHTKHLTGELSGFLAFRITRDWRVIFQFLDPETIYVIRVKNRKDIYR